MGNVVGRFCKRCRKNVKRTEKSKKKLSFVIEQKYADDSGIYSNLNEKLITPTTTRNNLPKRYMANYIELNEIRRCTTKPKPKENDKKMSLNDFEILRQIGAGSFGKVFLVKLKSSKIKTNKLYALKILDKEPVPSCHTLSAHFRTAYLRFFNLRATFWQFFLNTCEKIT